jgi:hypothetical protein
LEQLNSATDVLAVLPFEVEMREVQNIYYGVLQNTYPEFRNRERRGEKTAAGWAHLFRELGGKLRVRVE